MPFAVAMLHSSLESVPSAGFYHSADGRALGLEPVEENAHVPAHAEVPDAHVQIAPRLIGVVDLHPRGHAQAQGRLDHVGLRLLDPGMIPLPGEADAHGIVGGAELHHVHALHREHRPHVVHRGRPLDHHPHPLPPAAASPITPATTASSSAWTKAVEPTSTT